MRKQVTVLEVKGAEKRLYEFHYRPSAPLGEVYEALKQMERWIIQEMSLQDQKDENLKQGE